MKVRISYCVPVEKEIELTPSQYCNLRANHAFGGYFPDGSIFQKLESYKELSEEAKTELENFWDGY